MGPIQTMEMDSEKSWCFVFLSSIVCSVVHSAVLGKLLYLLDGKTDTHLFPAGSDNLYLNPLNPDQLWKLNFLIGSLLVAGAISIIGFKVRPHLKCCKTFVEKVENQ